jgi:hypothetical protein
MDGMLAAGAVLIAFLAMAGMMVYRHFQAAVRQRHPLLTSRVLDHEHVSLAGCDDPALIARAGAAARSCLRCQDRAACLRWLEGDTSSSLQQFCPNDDLIARLKG